MATCFLCQAFNVRWLRACSAKHSMLDGCVLFDAKHSMLDGYMLNKLAISTTLDAITQQIRNASGTVNQIGSITTHTRGGGTLLFGVELGCLSPVLGFRKKPCTLFLLRSLDPVLWRTSIRNREVAC